MDIVFCKRFNMHVSNNCLFQMCVWHWLLASAIFTGGHFSVKRQNYCIAITPGSFNWRHDVITHIVTSLQGEGLSDLF